VAYKILFTEDALSDLDVVLDHISADNPSAAEQFGTSLLNHVELCRDCLVLGFRSLGDPAFARSFILPCASIIVCTKIAG
jgi:plasmid stabilization system protein ParE